jgi:hypothetical protein
MLVGAGYTHSYRMRNSLIEGIARSISDVKKAATGTPADTNRIEKDISFTFVVLGNYCRCHLNICNYVLHFPNGLVGCHRRSHPDDHPGFLLCSCLGIPGRPDRIVQ